MAGEPREVTRLLQAIDAGREDARTRLVSLLYEPLRKLAHGLMQAERPGHTLQPTALVHEAWLKLVGSEQLQWQNRAHFFGAAAETMRRILVEHARRHAAAKRGGGVAHVSIHEHPDLEDPRADPDEPLTGVVSLDSALASMEADDRYRQKCAIVKLRCFACLTNEEVGRVLDLSVATVKRDWAFAKAWLYREMSRNNHP